MLRTSLLLAILLFVSLASTASPLLSGALRTNLAFDPTAIGIGDVVLPETLTTLTLRARYGGLSADSTAKLDQHGLAYVSASASTTFQALRLVTSLAFNLSPGENLTRDQTVCGSSHLYDLAEEYLAKELIVENVNATSSWCIRASDDAQSWTSVAGPFDPTAHSSGPVSVDMLLRYVEVRAATGTLVCSSASPERLSVRVAGVVSKTELSGPVGLVGLSGTLVSSGVGDGFLLVAATYRAGSDLSLKAHAKIGSAPEDCRWRFQQANLDATFSIGQVRGARATILFDESGLDGFSLAVKNIPCGIPWLAIAGKLEATSGGTELCLDPQVVIGKSACLALYTKAVIGAASAELIGVLLYGIRATCAVRGLAIDALSYLDGAHTVKVLGSQSCWQAVTLATSARPGCGGLTRVRCDICFSRASDLLFGLAEVDLALTAAVGSTTSVSLAAALETVGVTHLVLGLTATW